MGKTPPSGFLTLQRRTPNRTAERSPSLSPFRRAASPRGLEFPRGVRGGSCPIPPFRILCLLIVVRIWLPAKTLPFGVHGVLDDGNRLPGVTLCFGGVRLGGKLSVCVDVRIRARHLRRLRIQCFDVELLAGLTLCFDIRLLMRVLLLGRIGSLRMLLKVLVLGLVSRAGPAAGPSRSGAGLAGDGASQ